MDNAQSPTSDGVRVCPSCGARAPRPEARFCLACGKPLPDLGREQPAQTAAAGAPVQRAEEPLGTAPNPRADAPRRSPANALRCSKCGEYVVLDGGACPICNARIEQPGNRAPDWTGSGGSWASPPVNRPLPTKQCRICGAWNTSDSRDCLQCGRSLNSTYLTTQVERPVGAHWISLLAGAAAMLSSLLPWYSYPNSLDGTSTSSNGFSLIGSVFDNVGWYPMILGGVIVLLEWIALAGGKAGRGHWTAVIALAGVIAATLAANLQVLLTLSGNQANTSVSFGPYLALIAAIVIGIAAVTGLVGEE